MDKLFQTGCAPPSITNLLWISRFVCREESKLPADISNSFDVRSPQGPLSSSVTLDSSTDSSFPLPHMTPLRFSTCHSYSADAVDNLDNFFLCPADNNIEIISSFHENSPGSPVSKSRTPAKMKPISDRKIQSCRALVSHCDPEKLKLSKDKKTRLAVDKLLTKDAGDTETQQGRVFAAISKVYITFYSSLTI